METKIETFHSWVLILRLESRLLKFESWYRDWNRDSEILSLDIETGIETFEITVLISRLVSRLRKQGGITVIETLARVTAHLWAKLSNLLIYRLTVWDMIYINKYLTIFGVKPFFLLIMGHNYTTKWWFCFMWYIWDIRCNIKIYKNIHKRNDTNGKWFNIYFLLWAHIIEKCDIGDMFINV